MRDGSSALGTNCGISMESGTLNINGGRVESYGNGVQLNGGVLNISDGAVATTAGEPDTLDSYVYAVRFADNLIGTASDIFHLSGNGHLEAFYDSLLTNAKTGYIIGKGKDASGTPISILQAAN